MGLYTHRPAIYIYIYIYIASKLQATAAASHIDTYIDIALLNPPLIAAGSRSNPRQAKCLSMSPQRHLQHTTRPCCYAMQLPTACNLESVPAKSPGRAGNAERSQNLVDGMRASMYAPTTNALCRCMTGYL